MHDGDKELHVLNQHYLLYFNSIKRHKTKAKYSRL